MADIKKTLQEWYNSTVSAISGILHTKDEFPFPKLSPPQTYPVSPNDPDHLLERFTAIAQKAKINAPELVMSPEPGSSTNGKNVYLDKLVRAVFDRGEQNVFLAHEIAHVELGHTKLPPNQRELLSLDIKRQQELDADRRAVELTCDPDSLSKGLNHLEKIYQTPTPVNIVDDFLKKHPIISKAIPQSQIDRFKEKVNEITKIRHEIEESMSDHPTLEIRNQQIQNLKNHLPASCKSAKTH